MEYKFQYCVPPNEFQEFHKNNNHPDFAFYHENEKIPFFNDKGVVAYPDIDLKLKEPQLKKIYLGDTKTHMITEVVLDEVLFIKLLPNGKLYQVPRIRLIQHNKGKI